MFRTWNETGSRKDRPLARFLLSCSWNLGSTMRLDDEDGICTPIHSSAVPHIGALPIPAEHQPLAFAAPKSWLSALSLWRLTFLQLWITPRPWIWCFVVAINGTEKANNSHETIQPFSKHCVSTLTAYGRVVSATFDYMTAPISLM